MKKSYSPLTLSNMCHLRQNVGGSKQGSGWPSYFKGWDNASWIPLIPTCQIDALWIDNGSVSILRWSLKVGSESFGLWVSSRNLSALHAEIESLFWTASYIEIGDGLVELSEHDYESDGLTNMRRGDRDVLETTKRFQGCKPDLYSLEY